MASKIAGAHERHGHQAGAGTRRIAPGIMSDSLGLPPGLERTGKRIAGALNRALEEWKQTSAKMDRKHGTIRQAHFDEITGLVMEAREMLKAAGRIEDRKLQAEAARALVAEFAEKIKRVVEGQKLRAEMLQSAEPQPSQQIQIDYSMLAPGIDQEKVRTATRGLTAHLVASPLSEDFVRGFSLLSRFFPTDEIDPHTLVIRALEQGGKGEVQLNPQGKPEYTRFQVVVIKDERGRIIGAADGMFIANSEVNGFYMSHIAVLPEDRRGMVATLLQISRFTVCDGYAREAEQALGTAYPDGANGSKLMFAMLESEFPSLRPSEVESTWGRLIYHGVNGFSVLSPEHMRYRQSDTTWKEGREYNAQEWASVPLFFAIRGIGREVGGGDAHELLRLMYNSFIKIGMCAPGVEADWEYAVRNLTEQARAIPLPKGVEELREFISRHGDTRRILSRYYADSRWAQEYLRGSEQPIELDAAAAMLAKVKEPLPPRDL